MVGNSDKICYVQTFYLESFRFHHDAQHFNCKLLTIRRDFFISSLNLFSDPNII